jgi:hypothetical protein
MAIESDEKFQARRVFDRFAKSIGNVALLIQPQGPRGETEPGE